MRSIDNYTDKEREVLALKGMIAPRTADCIEWRSGGVTDTERIHNLQFSLKNEVTAHVKVIKERDNYKAHADKLAEALREIQKGEGAYNRDPLEHAGNTIDNMKRIATKALAAYEAAQ